MKKAFTLVELIVVIGIIGILMAVLMGTFSGSTESARAVKCEANMHTLGMAVQAVSMENHYFPRAGSYDQWDSYSVKDRKAVHRPGWISWSSKGAGGSYVSPYEPDTTSREFSITNGTLWTAVNRVRDCYVCPTHLRYCQDKSTQQTPLWSYVMNARFGWMSKDTPFSKDHLDVRYRSFKNSDRILLFGELPFAAMTAGDGETVQTGEIQATASSENDPILQYSGCAGGGNEAIGFNHKNGKLAMGHICFADAHVEKLRVPKDFDASTARELTKWLCEGTEYTFDGMHYEKMN